MRVFLYARVSMENVGDEREQNPEAQLGPLRRHCALKGWEVSHEYVERLSGADPLRPQFLSMLSAIKRKEADMIVVWAMDRFSRLDPWEAMGILIELKLLEVGFYSLQEPWASTVDNSVPENLRLPLVGLALSNSREEHDKISRRTKAGIAAKRAKGEWRGGRPKGSQDSKDRERRWDVKPEVDAVKILR